MKLTPDEKKQYLMNMLAALTSQPRYHVALSDEDCRMKFWVKKAPTGSIVVFDGWGYVNVRQQREVGAIIFSEPRVTAAFDHEFTRLLDQCGRGKDRKWVREQLQRAVKAI
jgi:hypothetical protein